MKTTKLQKAFVFGIFAAAGILAGCELIVDFDRTTIPVEAAEASIPDGSVLGDATFPTGDSSTDGAVSDAAPDAPAPSDAGSDADADAQ